MRELIMIVNQIFLRLKGLYWLKERYYLFLPEGHVEIVLCLHNCVCHKLSLNNDNDQQGYLVELSTLTCEN